MDSRDDIVLVLAIHLFIHILFCIISIDQISMKLCENFVVYKTSALHHEGWDLGKFILTNFVFITLKRNARNFIFTTETYFIFKCGS